MLLGIFYQLRGKKLAGDMFAILKIRLVCINTLIAIELWRAEETLGFCRAISRTSAILIREVILLASTEMLFLSTLHQQSSSISTSTASGGD